MQHLDILTDHEKNVFKTFSEISQLSIIQQAAQRQAFIDQSQSLNLIIHPDTYECMGFGDHASKAPGNSYMCWRHGHQPI